MRNWHHAPIHSQKQFWKDTDTVQYFEGNLGVACKEVNSV